ncbi:pseudouridine synthase [Synechococcus sp. A15-24]|uniref:pseudouridine synthase n=1 Tax=Synechococcus sp. A15-24 TaxID=1050635 RepID=UPI00164472A8|nr:pseudouridine synthase [Synechococcus sp. A15-24]QNJ28726.1 pseudouridine synthase [Synechococcus sp. A15-24]
MTRQRLQKLIAAAGLCSRRTAEAWIEAGRVNVDGQVASLGDQADPDSQVIQVDGRPLCPRREPTVLLINKPPGVISTCRDPRGRSTVLDLLPRQLRQGLHPVGRLDADSRGALLLTDQGELTLRLTHPRFDHAKTYRVWVDGTPLNTSLQRWRQGVSLDGTRTRSAEVRVLQRRSERTLLEVVLLEGRNRQIRRVADLLGHPVLDLQRVAIAGLRLGPLPEGRWRHLSRGEWQQLLDQGEPNGPCA